MNEKDSAVKADEADRLRVRIAALEHALRVYIHAHRTGNSVPPMIERDAMNLLKSP